MKKIAFLRNFGIAALFAILAFSFIGCTDQNVPNQDQNPTPEVDPTPKVDPTPDPIVNEVLDEIKLTAQETVSWSSKSTESVEITKATTSVVLEITNLSFKVIDSESTNKNANDGVLNLYINTIDGTVTKWTAQDSCIYKVLSVEVMVNDETEYKALTLDEDLADAEGPIAKGLEEDIGIDKQPLGTFRTKFSLCNPWWHDCVSGFATSDVLKAVKVTLSVTVK